MLAGKTLGMIFEKSSTRTRVSFEAGMVHLGGHALFLAPGNTQMGRGEPIKDTARCLARYLDGVMIRTFSQAVVEEFAHYSDVPVINGLTDSYHPCQVMADLFTVIEHKGRYQDLTYCWIGDGNNMANSWINAAAVFGFELRIATPNGYEPDAAVRERADRMGARILYTDDPLTAARGADVLNTDVWASMGMEAEQQQRDTGFPWLPDQHGRGAGRRSGVHRHALPAGPSRRGDHRRGHGEPSFGDLRSGRESPACPEGDHGDADGIESECRIQKTEVLPQLIPKPARRLLHSDS